MITKGITYAHIVKIVFLLALVAPARVFGQGDYSSRENISFTRAHNQVSSGLANTPAFKNAVPHQRLIGQKMFLPAPDTSETITGGHDYTFKRESKSDLAADENRTRPFGKNLQISFRATSFVYPEGSKEEVGVPVYPTQKLLLYAIVLKKYARENGFDTNYAFLSNMGMLSGKKRFFVINLATMEVERSGLVSQGRGQGRTRYDKQYSNTIESKCTSLGRYKVTNKYKGFYGESYRLIGLDSSNNNAFKRNVVFHPMGCIPDEENLAPACISEGCPAVSLNFFSGLSKIIDTREKPVLLWVFDSNLEDVVAEEIQTENKSHTCSIHTLAINVQP